MTDYVLMFGKSAFDNSTFDVSTYDGDGESESVVIADSTPSFNISVILEELKAEYDIGVFDTAVYDRASSIQILGSVANGLSTSFNEVPMNISSSEIASISQKLTQSLIVNSTASYMAGLLLEETDSISDDVLPGANLYETLTTADDVAPVLFKLINQNLTITPDTSFYVSFHIRECGCLPGDPNCGIDYFYDTATFDTGLFDTACISLTFKDFTLHKALISCVEVLGIEDDDIISVIQALTENAGVTDELTHYISLVLQRVMQISPEVIFDATLFNDDEFDIDDLVAKGPVLYEDPLSMDDLIQFAYTYLARLINVRRSYFKLQHVEPVDARDHNIAGYFNLNQD